MKTQAVEDYLKAIWELQSQLGRAPTSVLAERLGVTPASASTMVKRLARLGLVAHTRYRGVVLRPAGEKVALEVVRHHRLIECFLVESLGVPWDAVHDEAERWEHVLSEEVEARMDAALGYPATDPHGSPIPQADGGVAERAHRRLADLDAGDAASVAEVTDEDARLLRYLGGFGLFPGAELQVVGAEPFDGPLTVRVGGNEHTLGREAARHVRVREVHPA